MGPRAALDESHPSMLSDGEAELLTNPQESFSIQDMSAQGGIQIDEWLEVSDQ